ncbi:LOW QUALITY PROTEIN: capZ-interacting protein [Epinephelus moara]|uniref:LOW QUALITY PROTEIN: capZ-interacting protein n=1 Tax=Epinephelus moara TaxID=300413 RepID=UPI00214E5100|nr:LOW QUALITY PROTEIN: capZ-interacting protein [Epinephelus moara]
MRVKVVHSSSSSMDSFGSRYKHRLLSVPAALLSLFTTSRQFAPRGRGTGKKQEGTISGAFPRMEDSPSKPSVAELAGRFKGHILPMPTSNDEVPFRRRPPCSLKLQHQKDDEESDKTIVSPNPFKIKVKNSAIIEKLQANLALSPTALLPSPKSPEVKLQPAPLSPTTPCSPQSPLSPTLRSSRQSSEEEDPITFDSPPEGTTLPSFNKTRARLSFKRRPPTRQHRRSAGEEAGAFGSALSPCELNSPKENGDMDQVFEYGQSASLKEADERDRDCENTEDEVAKSDPDDRGDPEEEQDAEQAQNLEALEEEQQPSESCPAKETEEEEEMPQEKHQRGNDIA